MQPQPLLGRTYKITPKTGQRRCDFCHRIIPLGKTASQVTQGMAQGTYHGSRCYLAAKKHYLELKEKHVAPTEE